MKEDRGHIPRRPNKRLALTPAERIAHPFSLVAAQLFIAMLHLDRREPELASQRLATAEALAAEQRLSFFVEPRFLRGAALTTQGAFEEAVACFRKGLTGGLGGMVFRPFGLAGLAEALAQPGEHGAALTAAIEGRQAQSNRPGSVGRGASPPGRYRPCRPKPSRIGAIRLPRGAADRARSRQRPMNCEPRRASLGCGASRAFGPKRASCWHPSLAGLPKASTPPI